MLFSPPSCCSKRLDFVDLECHIPFLNSNCPSQDAHTHLPTQRCAWQSGFLKCNWNQKSLSHSLCPQEAFNHSISATGKSYYRAERLEENSTWYQSTRSETVSKLIDLSSFTTLTLSVCFPVLWCWKSCEMLLCRFPNQENQLKKHPTKSEKPNKTPNSSRQHTAFQRVWAFFFSKASASAFKCLQQLPFNIICIKGENKQQKVPEVSTTLHCLHFHGPSLVKGLFRPALHKRQGKKNIYIYIKWNWFFGRAI